MYNVNGNSACEGDCKMIIYINVSIQVRVVAVFSVPKFDPVFPSNGIMNTLWPRHLMNCHLNI